jgi:hypothetical protein
MLNLEKAFAIPIQLRCARSNVMRVEQATAIRRPGGLFVCANRAGDHALTAEGLGIEHADFAPALGVVARGRREVLTTIQARRTGRVRQAAGRRTGQIRRLLDRSQARCTERLQTRGRDLGWNAHHRQRVRAHAEAHRQRCERLAWLQIAVQRIQEQASGSAPVETARPTRAAIAVDQEQRGVPSARRSIVFLRTAAPPTLRTLNVAWPAWPTINGSVFTMSTVSADAFGELVGVTH